MCECQHSTVTACLVSLQLVTAPRRTAPRGTYVQLNPSDLRNVSWHLLISIQTKVSLNI
jgi:hypothetical protein